MVLFIDSSLQHKISAASDVGRRTSPTFCFDAQKQSFHTSGMDGILKERTEHSYGSFISFPLRSSVTLQTGHCSLILHQTTLD